MNNSLSKALYSSVLCVSLYLDFLHCFRANTVWLKLLLTPLFKAYLSVRSAHCLLHLQLKNTPLAWGDEQKQSWTLSSRRWQRRVWIKTIDNNSPTKKLCNLKTISNAQNKGTATSKRSLEQQYQIPERLCWCCWYRWWKQACLCVRLTHIIQPGMLFSI